MYEEAIRVLNTSIVLNYLLLNKENKISLVPFSLNIYNTS